MKKNYFFLALVLFSAVSFAQNNDFNNGAADGGLWTSATNWSLGITPTSAHTVRTANSAVSFVNSNFTIFRLQNLSGTTGDRFVNSSSGGILTIDQNDATLGTAIAIQNVSSSGVKLGLRGKINIQNSQATSFSRITNANNAANSIEFETTSTLTLTTPLEVYKAGAATSGNNFFFNGKLEGSGNFRLAANTTATFGNSVTNAGYTGELVLLGGASLVVNTTDDVIFYDGLKIQVNGNASTTLNGQNVFKSGIVVGGTNTFTFNVNKNQNAMTNIVFQGAGTLNMAIDNTVTSIVFADNSASAWLTGTLNITGFKNNLVFFGVGGLTDTQLNQITADTGVGAISIDDDGYLTRKDAPLSAKEFQAFEFSIYPNPAIDVLNIQSKSSLISKVAIYDITGKQVLVSNKIMNNEINVSNLKTGIYAIRLEDTNNNVSTKKLVIQ